MPFGGLKLTDFGAALLHKTQRGDPLILTRVALGDGVLGVLSASDITALLSEKASFLISTVEADDNGSTVIVKCSSDTLEQGFYYREIAVMAKDPDTGDEGAYLYDNCRSGGEYFGDKNDLANRVSALMRLHIRFAQTDNIVLEQIGDPLYVLYDEFLTKVDLLERGLAFAQSILTDHEMRIAMLEDALFNDLTTNAFTVRFDTLDGVVAVGVYNETLQRLEC